MKTKVLMLLAIVSAVFFFTSCDGFPIPGVNDVGLNKKEFTLPAEGGQVDVTFLPVASWSARCSDSFVTISPDSGTASEEKVTLSITVDKNPKPIERVIKVLLSVGEQDIVLTITQAGATSSPETPDNPDPEDPDDPDDPVDPDDPDDPVDPDKPDPDDPDDPVDPDKPDPDDPDDPVDPDKPDPDDPDDPVDPDKPDPDDPDDPDPDDPVDPDDSEYDGENEDVIPGEDIDTTTK